MKVVNIVLSALILVLALVCTGFSYVLFAKRANMVKGWGEMAKGVYEASAELDKGTGTHVAASLTEKELAHDTYDSAKMNSKMAALKAQSKKVVSQRDEFVGDLQEIGKTVRMKEVPDAAQLVAESGSAGDGSQEVKGSKAIVKQVAVTVKQRDAAQKNVKQLRGEFNKVGSIVGVEDGGRNTSEVVDSVRRRNRELEAKKSELDRTRAQLADERSEKARIENDRDRLRRDMNAARQEKIKLEKELDQVKADFKALTQTEYGDIPLWRAGSAEARAHVTGTVTKVDPKNGYIIFDIGTSSRAVQKVGTKQLRVDPQFRPGMELVVIRGGVEEPITPKFVARIKILNIDEKCAVANIPKDTAIQEGDIVIDNAFYENASKREQK